MNKPEPSAEQNLLLAKMNGILSQHWTATRYQKADPRPLGPGTCWPTGWHNLIYPIDDEKLAILLETLLAQTVSKACSDILHHIKLLEDVYREAVNSRPLD